MPGDRASCQLARIRFEIVIANPLRMPPHDFELEENRWFTEEVRPHEASLRSYLHARFPSLSDHDDLVQETYIRLLRARAKGGIQYVKGFIFTTARNAALDWFRRQHKNHLCNITDISISSVLAEQQDAAEIASQTQELEILADAVRALPERCRLVVMLRYVDGLSYKEIAQRLDISPETVKVHLAKGMRRCADYFQAQGWLKSSPPADPATKP